MPLITISGFPASGKTYRAKQLIEFFQKTTERKVVVLSENDIVKSHSVYSGKLVHFIFKEKFVIKINVL